MSDGNHLIFNTFSDSRVVVDQSVLEALKKCRRSNLLTSMQKKQLRELGQLGIVLPDDADEDKQLEYWFQRIKFDCDTLNVTILTTLACNMDCVYCFEQGIDSNRSMDHQMVEKVCSWILERTDDVHPKGLTITFFGGEPLLNMDAVYGISEILHQGTLRRGVKLNLELITNGLLLTNNVIEHLIPLGLKWAKITLDGYRDTHNKMRPYKSSKNNSGGGTYDKIITNLLNIRGRIPLIIGGNYDQGTKNSIPKMLDDLIALDFKAEHFKKIAFKPILAFPGHQSNSIHTIEACTYAETDMEDLFWLIEETEKRGLPSFRKLGLGPCEAMRDNTYTIDPEGAIYKCAAMAGRKQFSIGNIEDELENILFSPQNIAYITSDAWKQCKKCPFVPLCGGGCRLGSVSANGTFDDVSCEREYFEKISIKLVVNETLEMMK